MKSVQSYLENRLKNCSSYSLTDSDRENIETKGIESYLFNKLTTKKFRKWRLDPACEARTKKAIHIAVSHNKPIHVVYFLGGYKLWRLPSSPEADWAEFFNIAYVLEYLSPIAAAYKPGVILSYFTHTLLMERHDNLDITEINTYMNSLQIILNSFLKYTPVNMTARIWRDEDLYGRDEYFKALDEGLEDAKKQYELASAEKQMNWQKLGRLNIKWKGKEDWNGLNEEEKKKKIVKGIYFEIAAVNVLKRFQMTAKGEDKVCIFTEASPLFIGTGSTKNSIVKHWTGFGVLEKRNENYEDRILSPSQLEQVNTIPSKTFPISLIPLSNLKQISLFNTPSKFTHTIAKK